MTSRRLAVLLGLVIGLGSGVLLLGLPHAAAPTLAATPRRTAPPPVTFQAFAPPSRPLPQLPAPQPLGTYGLSLPYPRTAPQVAPEVVRAPAADPGGAPAESAQSVAAGLLLLLAAGHLRAGLRVPRDQ